MHPRPGGWPFSISVSVFKLALGQHGHCEAKLSMPVSRVLQRQASYVKATASNPLYLQQVGCEARYIHMPRHLSYSCLGGLGYTYQQLQWQHSMQSSP